MTSQFARDCDRRLVLAGLALGLGGGLAACGSRAGAQGLALACPVTPTEIRGPFPADGVGGADRSINVLDLAEVVRRDIRPSFAGLVGVAPGVAMELALTVAESGADCAPLAGRAVYLWQCDARGDYSLYNRTEVNWLRGLQVADDAGVVRFTSVVPGCYGGRAPHLHLEVFADLAAARGGAAPLLVSQLGLPTEACAEVYADGATYGDSAANLARWPAERDWAFRDERQAIMMVAMAGNPAGGYRGSARLALASAA